MEAAYQIVRLVEDLIVAEQLHFCPVQIIPALYSAVSILGGICQSNSNTTRRLARLKYEVCTMALRDLENVHPVCRWVLSAVVENRVD